MFNIVKKEIDWCGKKLSLETGKVGRQASTVIVRMGETVVMANVTTSRKELTGIDFMPLTVNYLEKSYAAGKIPGGFFKREAKPSEEATLTSRLIDRPIRPLFPSNYKYATDVNCTVLSYDPECNPAVVAMIAASAALSISPAPFQGPIAGVRVGYRNGEYELNPVNPFAEEGKLDLFVAGSDDSILMVESEAKELSEEEMLKAVMFGHKSIKEIVKFISSFADECKVEKIITSDDDDSELVKKVTDYAKDKIATVYKILDKKERSNAAEALRQEVQEKLVEDSENAELMNKVANIVSNLEKEIVRVQILETSKRIDGRAINEVRPIEVEVDVLPFRVHGSALFTRGETQAIVSATLGSSHDEQMIDHISGVTRRDSFLLHYNFPAYAVGETGFPKPPGRRELGHGKLANRAVSAVLPEKKDFPYTLRIVSEITESNGSSSMATVCGASLALMAAGVPIKNSVAGIAMGLIKGKDKYTVLSDIMADEDHLGDMDFKVAGTKDGVTALQMDIKCQGITEEIMQNALKQANEGRLHILGKMDAVIAETRPEVSKNVPKVKSVTVPKFKIKDIIGPHGKTIKGMCEKTGANIDIDDDGIVRITANTSEAMDEVVKMIDEISFEPEVGQIYEGSVVKIIDAGAFVSIAGNKDGFVHISELADYRVDFVDDILSEGDAVKIKVIGFDRKGRPKLSYKAVDQKTGEDLSKEE